jgi:hypothetical protein
VLLIFDPIKYSSTREEALMICRSVGIALSLATALAFAVSPVSAAKKISYEKAWETCKQEIGANVPWADTNMSAARYTAGAACMKKYGYRLKK